MNPNAEKVSLAFSKQSEIFDQMCQENKLSEYLRDQFREEVLGYLKPGSSILELNCGTGLDAVYFAEKGFRVLATDNAPGMLARLEKKIEAGNLEQHLRAQRCSFHDLHTLQGQKFDHILSNFGGLNCTGDLDNVLQQFAPLLNEGGKVSLAIMPKVCPWELLLLFKGRFRTAFRRFKNGTPARVEGVEFLCYYYNPGYVTRSLKKQFDKLALKGVFITVPPEFYLNFVERYPRLFSFLKKVDRAVCRFFPFTHCCDHYIITLQKK